MLRFFRNIRQKLIEQENVRKYIWYALGEVTPYLMRFDDFGNLSVSLPELNNYRLKGRPIEDCINDPYINNALKIKRIQLMNQNASCRRLLEFIDDAMKTLINEKKFDISRYKV